MTNAEIDAEVFRFIRNNQHMRNRNLLERMCINLKLTRAQVNKSLCRLLEGLHHGEEREEAVDGGRVQPSIQGCCITSDVGE